MAKLVAVCRDDEFPFERRQIPLMIEETLTMVMEIPETVISADCVSSSDVSQFIKRYSCLTHNEMNAALMVGQKELFALLAVSVPCVGCRRSVERLYNQLWESGQPAIEPLIIAASGVLTLSESFLVDAKLIYALFYIHGSHLNDIVDTVPKSRRNRRCILHSLETHKARASGSWMDVWDLLSQECRDEVVLIDSDSLLDTLEAYLRKHRFCSECKSKVLKAYSILAGDIDGDAEKGYCAGLYDGLKSCPKERHIHVVCDTDFIAHLIGRAEPELAGGRRERHARTIDIAQEEVLTCLGIHLWERLHRLWQKLRAEEQTWQMLFYLGVEALRKSFETAVEEKQGISQLELVVEEISEAERAKEQRKENKRLKKKKRKENKAKLIEEKAQQEEKVTVEEADEKCSVEGDHQEATQEYPESVDSEKSSSESQISPRKVELESSSDVASDVSLQNSQSSSCGSLDDKPPGLLKCVNGDNGSVSLPGHKEDPCDDENDSEELVCIKCNARQCSHLTTTNNFIKQHDKRKQQQQPCKSSQNSCKDSNANGTDSFIKNCSENSNKSNSEFESKHQCHATDGKNHSLGKGGDHCKCDNGSSGKQNKRNGYTNHYQSDYRGQYKSVYNKRNGYYNSSDCRGCANVGPRFQRYEEQGRWKGDGHDYQQHTDVYDKVHTINGSLGGGGRGRGKRKGHNKQMDSSESSADYLLKSSGGKQNARNSIQQGSSTNVPTEVVDENELRLLKMMGWTTEDSHGISEQEIQEFTANRPDVQTRREELRDKLREQFDKLCVNKVCLPCTGTAN